MNQNLLCFFFFCCGSNYFILGSNLLSLGSVNTVSNHIQEERKTSLNLSSTTAQFNVHSYMQIFNLHVFEHLHRYTLF